MMGSRLIFVRHYLAWVFPDVIYVVLAFASTILISRWLGPEKVGLIGVIVMVSVYGGFFPTCVYEGAGVHVPRLLAEGKDGTAEVYLGTALTTGLGSIIFL